ncbi:class I SAM-dependent methyltransferase [Ktedonobacter racemifer]|nr:class I SAM-dependent methyltransferase [Ktedonobacter racemifer]
MFHASHRIYAETSTHGPLLLDPLASAEQARVITQYHMLASALKEPLPELEELGITTSTSPHLILDLGCGPGGTWACDVAFDDPFCLVFGISALAPYVRQANTFRQMQTQTRVQFLQMDFARELCCPANFSTLINGHFLRTFLTQAGWPRLLRECWRVLRPGGLLRLTECIAAFSNSPACEALTHYYEQALAVRTQIRPSQHEECHEGSELASSPLQHTRLFELLHNVGYCGIEEQRMMLDFSAGTLYQASMRTNAESFFCQLAPVFYQTTDLTTARFEEIFEQMRAEMSSPTFKGHWILSRIHAYKPGGVQ